MKPQDHSDTTLLVWSDWLEENGEEQKAHELREEIANPPRKRWGYTSCSSGTAVGGDVFSGVGGISGGSGVGGGIGYGIRVGSGGLIGSNVGHECFGVGGG